MVGGGDPEALSAAPEAERKRLAITIVAVDHHGTPAAECVVQVVGKRLADPALPQVEAEDARRRIRRDVGGNDGKAGFGVDRLHRRRHSTERGADDREGVSVRDATRGIARAFDSASVVDDGQVDRQRFPAGVLDAHLETLEHLGADIRRRAGEGKRGGDTQGWCPLCSRFEGKAQTGLTAIRRSTHRAVLRRWDTGRKDGGRHGIRWIRANAAKRST